MPLLEAELAPDLTLLRPLGQGDRSHVFLARDVQLERLVAVKVLAADRTDDHQGKMRFLRAARAAAALRHPHVVQLHRFGFLPTGLPYLVMGYIKGATLQEKLAAEGPPEISVGSQMLADVADALAAAHAGGFIHRDLRPANILVESETGKVLVTGFGVAGLVPGGRDAATRVTTAGEIFGKAPYASPEQLRGEPVGEAADMYSLGVIGFELLTGESLPADYGASGTGVARDSPASTRAFRSTHPRTADLLDRCLSEDPQKRPSAAYLMRALREPLGHHGNPPSPYSEHSALAAAPRKKLRRSADLIRRMALRAQAGKFAADGALGMQRRLAAVWFADLVGYVRLSSENERTAMRVVVILQRAARRVVEEAGGTVVKFLGDEVLAEFSSTEVALQSAHRLLREFESDLRKAKLVGQLRIGMHLGDVAGDAEGDIYGEGVNLAARLVAEAPPGSVWVSEDVWRQLRRRPNLRFHSQGQREFKGVEEPLGVYESLEPSTPPQSAAGVPPAPAPPRKFLMVAAALGALLILGLILWSM